MAGTVFLKELQPQGSRTEVPEQPSVSPAIRWMQQCRRFNYHKLLPKAPTPMAFMANSNNVEHWELGPEENFGLRGECDREELGGEAFGQWGPNQDDGREARVRPRV
ncbi:hypothetical protein HPP92_001064 [Vanilla planifolia]|uniref:Uncharacterized protein n=1 Tax=Vanilla planifolia TaxID=51239 RepID=A0A835VJB9_VANPL|nr:hypothetical protein HPP92_001064 [Vanilla planifolia]